MIEFLMLLAILLTVVFSIFSCICLVGLTQFLIKTMAVTKLTFAFLVCMIGVSIFLIIGYFIRIIIEIVTRLTKQSDQLDF